MTVDFKEYSRRMDKALEHLDEEFASVRAGRALYIGIEKVGVSAFFIVEEASADLLKEEMSLKLKVV